MRKFVYYWLPLLAWLATIFYFSSHAHVNITQSTFYDLIIFKILHMIEYAILYFLFFRAIYSLRVKTLSINEVLILAVLFSILYSISDEIHQTFIPTREGRIRDVLIDTTGIVLMYIYIKYKFRDIKDLL